MSEDRPASPWPLPGVATESWIIRFDEAGICTSPRTLAAALDRLSQASDSPVLLFSHGWNNDFTDATALYAKFLQDFEKALEVRPLPGPSPIFVGVVWPSVWLPSDDGPQMAASPMAAADRLPADRVLAALRNTLPQGTDWGRLYAMLDADRVSIAEARDLAAMLGPALRSSSDGADEAGAAEASILRALADLQDAFGPRADDGGDIDHIGTVGEAGTGSPGAAGGLPPFLDPRWALRLATLYLMKDRAGAVGWNGVAQLLRDILARSRGAVYAIGHSFGAKVVLSAVAAQDEPSRKVRSMLLLQPAVSHLCFARTVPGREGPGGYRPVLDRLEDRIFTTYSANDFPLHEIYHRALLRRSDLGEIRIGAAGEPPSAYAALGGYGPRGADQHLVDPIPEPGTAVTAPAGTRLIGLDGSRSGRIGGHGDVANRFTAWALRELIG